MPVGSVTHTTPSPSTPSSSTEAPTSFMGKSWSVIKSGGKHTLAGLITLVVTPILITFTILGKADLGAIFLAPSAGKLVWDSAKYFIFKEGNKPTKKTNDFLQYVHYNSNGKFFSHYDPKIHGGSVEMTAMDKRSPGGQRYYHGHPDALNDPDASAFAKLSSIFQDANPGPYYRHYHPGIHDTEQLASSRRARARVRAIRRAHQEKALRSM